MTTGYENNIIRTSHDRRRDRHAADRALVTQLFEEVLEHQTHMVTL